MREVRIFGGTVNCEAGEDYRDFVERVLSESGDPGGAGFHEWVERRRSDW
jgi:hypothetical protein